MSIGGDLTVTFSLGPSAPLLKWVVSLPSDRPTRSSRGGVGLGWSTISPGSTSAMFPQSSRGDVERVWIFERLVSQSAISLSESDTVDSNNQPLQHLTIGLFMKVHVVHQATEKYERRRRRKGTRRKHPGWINLVRVTCNYFLLSRIS